jgi:hypothetical protein
MFFCFFIFALILAIKERTTEGFLVAGVCFLSLVGISLFLFQLAAVPS